MRHAFMNVAKSKIRNRDISITPALGKPLSNIASEQPAERKL